MSTLLESSDYPRVIFKASDKKYYYYALGDAQVWCNIERWIRYCDLLLNHNLKYLNDIDILNLVGITIDFEKLNIETEYKK